MRKTAPHSSPFACSKPLIERSVRLAPKNAMFRQNFGLMLAETGDVPAAAAQFEALVRRDADEG